MQMLPPASTDRPNTIHWPPLLYVLTLADAAVLHWFWPLPVIAGPPTSAWIGWPVFALGAGIGLAGILRFRAVGTSFDPTAPAAALATGGIYRYTRNPMYLGALVGFAGLGLALHWTWLIVLIPAVAIALRRLAIDREEAYLERRFGTAYLDYTARVRRWI
jgi:protein-S-isoprenylcysteine O-methyltransferase Ste14